MSLPGLVEIGTEEIPDWMIVPAINELQDKFQALLDQFSLNGRVISAYATPRRLVVRAEGLLDRQPDSEELLLGPPKSAGAGAATGFAKKMGTTPDQLGTGSTAKGEYFSFRKRTHHRRLKRWSLEPSSVSLGDRHRGNTRLDDCACSQSVTGQFSIVTRSICAWRGRGIRRRYSTALGC